MAHGDVFRVWVPVECDEVDAARVEAYDAGDAAEIWAADDHDGLNEGCYEHGCEIHVRDESGVLHRFRVYVDYDPTFTAHEIEESATSVAPEGTA
jgi:hypothetical protein